MHIQYPLRWNSRFLSNLHAVSPRLSVSAFHKSRFIYPATLSFLCLHSGRSLLFHPLPAEPCSSLLFCISHRLSRINAFIAPNSKLTSLLVLNFPNWCAFSNLHQECNSNSYFWLSSWPLWLLSLRMNSTLMFLFDWNLMPTLTDRNTRASIKDARGGQWVRRDDKGTCSPPDGIEAPCGFF